MRNYGAIFKRYFRIALVVIAVAFLFTLGEDHRSCIRQVPLRKELGIREDVLRSFLLSAADTREKSAIEETGTQAEIDLQAADQYRIDANRLHNLPVPNCNKIFPST